jgi:ADP-L-glycero-D-manno-heptose 6-epimerase
MAKILVTGNKGFIGAALQRRLEEMAHEVVGIEEWIFDRVRWKDRLTDYLHDIAPEVVFHVGACSDTQNQNLTYMMERNVESTLLIADWCEYKDIPFIYSSSASVTGTKNIPETLYAWSKYLGEEFALKCGGTALRYFNVYGNGEQHKGKMASMIYQSFMKHKNGEEVKLFPKKPLRDFIYIEDVVNANIHAWENYHLLKGIWWNIGTGISYSFEDVLNHLGIPFTYTSEDEIPANYQFFTEADPRYFMRDWKAKWSLKDGISDYVKILNNGTV